MVHQCLCRYLFLFDLLANGARRGKNLNVSCEVICLISEQVVK